jgi:hypothetical protein
VQFPHQNRPPSSALATDAVGVRCIPPRLALADEYVIPLLFNSLERGFDHPRLYNTAPVPVSRKAICDSEQEVQEPAHISPEMARQAKSSFQRLRLPTHVAWEAFFHPGRNAQLE